MSRRLSLPRWFRHTVLLGCGALLLLTLLTRKISEHRATVAVNPPVDAGPAHSLARERLESTAPSVSVFVSSSVENATRRDELDQLFASTLTNPNASQRREALRGIAEYLADHDVERAKDYVQSIIQLNDRAASGDAYMFTRIFADRLAAEDPLAVIAWARDVPNTLKDVAYQLAARHWSERDPRAVGVWALTIEDDALRATVIRAVGHQLLHADVSGFGSEWAAHLARTPDGPRFSDLIVRQWARSDPAAAYDWATQLHDVPERTGAIVALSTTLAENDPQAAVAWASNLPEGELRQRCVQQTVSVWASHDPASAAAWVSARATHPQLVESTVHSIANAWMQRDPIAATRWLQTAPVRQETKDYILTLFAARRPTS